MDLVDELHARVGLMLIGLIVAMLAVGTLIIRNEEAEDGEEKEVR